ncbi:MAG TPA: N-formylglutamate amidohydrolase, partial [Thalassospira sp.]|nr:N-formylglutamate amidohydrolase [Thalassospira sp.]
MNQLPSELASTGPATVILPPRQTLPVVFASPHSGRQYPQDLIERA